jgi:hypothetical protein
MVDGFPTWRSIWKIDRYVLMKPFHWENDAFESVGTCEWTYQTLGLARIVIEGWRGVFSSIGFALDMVKTF